MTVSQVKPKSDSLVTIVVSCAGQLEYTRLCVTSLLRFSRLPFELIFLDSDSLDGTREFLDGVATAAPIRVDVIQVSETSEQSRARKEENLAIRGDYLVLLNNDTIVSHGWLEQITHILKMDANAGVVAPMSNLSTPALQVATDGIHLGEVGSDHTRANVWAIVDGVNQFAKTIKDSGAGLDSNIDKLGGACAVLRREVLNRIGLFPSRTPMATFDFASLGAKVLETGLYLKKCQGAYVHNFGTRYAK